MFWDVAKVLPRLLFAPRAFSSYSAARGASGCHRLLCDGALNIHHPAKEPSAPFRVRGEELIALTLQSYPQQIWVARALGKFLIIRFLHLCTTTWWFLAIKSNGQHWIAPKTSLTQNTNCSSVQYINNSKKKNKSPQLFKTTRPTKSSASSQALVSATPLKKSQSSC